MKIKKTILILSIILILYLGFGALLLYTETIQRLYIFPGWSIKHGKTDEDNSTVGSDGPIIIYENGKIINCQILSKDSLFVASKVEISKQDSLSCYVDETKDLYKFQLKDRIKIEPTEYSLPNKMLIISDIEGNFNGFKSILTGNKIIDNNLVWIFGENHLVLVGDFFDRGLNVTECLWLIYKLEKEAEKQGGKVHFILGNHELINLKNDFRYVRDKYLENANKLKLDYKKWYATNTELGRWLRSKNSVEKIGDYLFVHAGIRKDFPLKYSLKEINDNIRKSIDILFEKDKQRNDIFIGNDGPLWYRGIAKEDESQRDVENTLAKHKASKMIIGHTVFEEIQFLYNQKVIVIDLAHKINSENGKMFALWFEGKEFKTTDQNGIKTTLK